MVKAWREDVVIPTYEVGEAEKNPIFLEKRVYQGSSGVVYPYPVIEKIADTPVDHTWHAVWIENEYIRVMILPELGGRVQMAFDKIKERHFVYYNHVIKPALVGLLGPWISGGIEFNWPQHHRPSTYMPVDCKIEENADGSVTVWVSEMEKMFGQKGMAGFTLRPGCAYLEIKGQLYNRTDVPQTFLWWANPAVEVGDDYQSVFPQDVNAVFDHGKRAVSSFPIATGTYYKMDYSSGVDISNYKNIKVPTSYMAVNSKYNFEGGYENEAKAGMLHVASNHFSPGKKQWTWGNGDFGRAWDRALTDNVDANPNLNPNEGLIPLGSLKKGFRPYIELMAGVYTENQPDFTWLMPYEEKQFVQYFMPYRELGIVKNASKDLMINVIDEENASELRLFATSRQKVRVVMEAAGQVVYDQWHEVSPEAVLSQKVEAKVDKVILMKEQYGKVRPVLTWAPEPDEIRAIPDAAEAALLPADVKTNEQLFLTGQHIEQYRHATYVATDYYEEALRRDPNDIRCLNAMGLWNIRKGRFEKAEPYLRKAVKLLMKRNPNPYEGEPLYNLALCLKRLAVSGLAVNGDRLAEAYNLFWKVTWNKGWADAGYFEAAKISVADERLDDALEELRRCLNNNAHNQKALALKTIVLRKMGRKEEALALIEQTLQTDLFNYVARYEKWLLTGEASELELMQKMMHGASNNYDQLALDYADAGCKEEAEAIWNLAIEAKATTPMTYYYLGRWKEAEQADSAYCFPNSLEALQALKAAIANNPQGAKAYYYLGCLYYDKRQYDVAMEAWEKSAELDSTFPTVLRNLALGYFNKQHKAELAVDCMERAFALDTTDARIFMELDQLYKRLGRNHRERLARFEKYMTLVEQRDDLRLEYATLLNFTYQFEEAYKVINDHHFHAWEGGEGKVPAQYQLACTELAKSLLKKKDQHSLGVAINWLQNCFVYPDQFGEGKLFGAQENDFNYYLGCAWEKYASLVSGDERQKCMDTAKQYFEAATLGNLEPAAAMYYNDAKPEKIFYQGLALRKLGREDEAKGRFYKLLNYGKQHIFDNVVMDYFAVSLPDLQIWEGDLNTSNQIHCRFMLALGYFGLGNMDKARLYLDELLAMDPNHIGAFSLQSLY